uniref:DUF4220 domain-containing protein n=1 Tax=Oryza nivara TaxID=4536 RepID=A0A0E0HKG2_ORYNI
MGLSSAVQWWEEWQLRVLVLGSLGVQYFLAIFGGRRKSPRFPPWYRFFIWLSYLASDALAVYALATLFNCKKKLQHDNNGSHDLEVTVAIYVFCQSWSSSADRRLLAAAILLFIVGIVKCFEKPMSLKAASFNELVSSNYDAELDIVVNREEMLESFVNEAKALLQRSDHSPPASQQDGWTKYIEDAESYRSFNDNMGQWALERAKCTWLLGWSLEKPFDEIVLIWHVATDFCFHKYHESFGPPNGPSFRVMSRAISNYMMHLLFANPKMLMAGSRSNLFTTAYRELESILHKEKNLPVDDEEKLTLKVIEKVEHKRNCFIHDAFRLARDLLLARGYKKMWDVIIDVWVEMLCFSAGRCRGYLHAKSLGSGVEYLSHVWLLLAHAGMKTFPERLQRRQLFHLPTEEPEDEREDGVIGPSDSQGSKNPHNLKEEGGHGVAPTDTSQGAESRKEKQDQHVAPSAPQGEGSIVPGLSEIIVVPPATG